MPGDPCDLMYSTKAFLNMSISSMQSPASNFTSLSMASSLQVHSDCHACGETYRILFCPERLLAATYSGAFTTRQVEDRSSAQCRFCTLYVFW